MTTHPTLWDTIRLVKEVCGQELDKASIPVYFHPISVMNRLPEWAPESWRHAALLHDVIEDSALTRADLAARGYSNEILDIVDLVSLKENGVPKNDLPYPAKIRNIIDSGNEGAIRVKFADMSENSSHERLHDLPEDIQQELRDKYRFPLQMLKEAVAELDAVRGDETATARSR